jgi:hypothetical protein
MDQHRVLILGNSLSAEALTQILQVSHQLGAAKRVSTIEMALEVLASQEIDALLMIGTADETSHWYLSALNRYPDLPILRSDLSTPKIQVITSRCIEARLEQLLEAIAALPRRDRLAPDLEPIGRREHCGVERVQVECEATS